MKAMKVDKLTNFNKTMKILKENHSNWGSGTCPSTKVLIVPSNNLSNLQNSKTINKIMQSNKSVNLNKIMESNKSANLNNIMKSNKSVNLNKIMESNKSVNLNKIMESNKSVNLNKIMQFFKITKLIKNIFATTFVVFLASCGGGGGDSTATPTPTPDSADTAVWSSWSDWSPANNTNTSIVSIEQTRTRTCQVTVNGSADSPAPTCSGSISETRTFANPLAVVNKGPVAIATTITSAEDSTTTITLSGTDVDGATVILTYQIATQPANGTVSLNDNIAIYTANADYSGNDSFAFTVTDGGGAISQPAIVNITISAVNDAPVAIATTITLAEDSTTTIALNGTDVDGADVVLTYQITTQPTNGTVSLNDNIAIYTANADYSGNDSFAFTVTDGGGAISQPAIVNITISAVNDAPVAIATTITLAEDSTTTIALNGTDVDGADVVLTYQITTQPVNGTVSLNDNIAIYTANADYSGNDSFAFTVTDGGGAISQPAIVNITISAVNDAPVAIATTITLAEDSTTTIALNGTDVDGADVVLTYQITTQPTNGTVSLNDNIAIYTANANYNGNDSFTFTVTDGIEVSQPAIVNITIMAVNDAPIAIPSATTVLSEDSTTTITLLGSDFDGTSGNLTYQIAMHPANGTVAISNDIIGFAIVTYTPNDNYNGSDSFTFTVTDGGDAISQPAIVNITISAVNDAPVAIATTSTYNLAEDSTTTIALNGTDVDGADVVLTYQITTPPTNGTVILNDNIATYTANADYNGSDSFAFTVTDGIEVSQPAIVNITIMAVNDAPVAIAPASITTLAEDSTTTITLSGTDIDGVVADLTYQIVKQPANGAVVLDGNIVSYTPNANYNGSDSFAFTVNDGVDISQPTIANITIMAVNDAPVASDLLVAFNQNGNTTTITLEVSDIDGDTLVYIVVSTPHTGVLSDIGPNPSYFQDDKVATSFTFIVTDDGGLSDTATVNIVNRTLTAVNNDGTIITLNWSSGDYFKLYRVNSSNETTLIYEGTGQSYTDSNLTPGTNYSYQIVYCTDANTCESLVTMLDTGTIPDIYDFASFGQYNNTKDFNTLTTAGNTASSGIWSDGTTMWVADFEDGKIYAYNLATKDRDSSKDFTNTLTVAGNTNPTGIWSNGTTMWVADNGTDKIYAYNLATKARDSSKEINALTAAGNNDPVGIWSDGITMWVADSSSDRIYAYTLATKSHNSGEGLNSLNAASNNDPSGIWSDGTTMWVADATDNKIYAYNLVTKASDSSKDFNSLATDNNNPYGIWSDGTTMWVADSSSDRIYAYNFSFIEVVTAQSSTAIALSWDAIAGASIYRIYRSTEVNGVYTALEPVASPTTTDSDLNASTKYYYQIVACTLDNNSDSAGDSCSNRNHSSAQAIATTMPSDNATYSLVITDTSENQINLSWTTTGTNFVRISASTTTDASFTEIYSGTATNFINTSLVAGTSYYYRLQLCSDNSIGSCFALGSVSSIQTATVPYMPFGQYNSNSDFNTATLAVDNDSPRGIWSDGTTMWVADDSAGIVYAYNLATKAYDSSKNIDLTPSNGNPSGIWSNGTTMWVLDHTNDRLYAYNLATKIREVTREFNLTSINDSPSGIWSNSTTMWVADSVDRRIYAYNLG